jgi:hypothetical protein
MENKIHDLFDGWNKSLSRREEREVNEFLSDNFPESKLKKLSDGRFYLQE